MCRRLAGAIKASALAKQFRLQPPLSVRLDLLFEGSDTRGDLVPIMASSPRGNMIRSSPSCAKGHSGCEWRHLAFTKILAIIKKYPKYFMNVSQIFVFFLGIFEARMEEKREKFVRLAEQRVNRALNDIRLIGNLSNRSAYSFTDEDVKKIFRALQKELEQAKSRFSDAENASGGDFKL